LRVFNRHSRKLQKSPEAVGKLLDSLASRSDGLWPHELWPRMAFDKPLGVGAKGGHGPIRYTVESYEPGRFVTFRFTSPKGFLGTHVFTVEEADGETELTHTIDMKVRGGAILTWPMVFRPLHDALLEDALDKAQASLGGGEWERRGWSTYVRSLRRLLAKRRR